MAPKVLVYQTAFWGDLLLAGPLLSRIAQIFPKSEIHLVCRKGFGQTLIDLGLVHTAYEYDKSQHPSLRSWVRRFRGQVFDLLICPHQSVRSMLAVSMIRARTKIGFRTPWNFFVFNHRVARSMALPDYLRQLELLVPMDPWLGDQFLEWRKTHPCVTAGREDLLLSPPPAGLLDNRMSLSGFVGGMHLTEMERWLRSRPTVLIAPGSQWNTKRWTTSGFRLLTEKLRRESLQVAFIGSSTDQEIVKTIGVAGPDVQDWTGRTSPSELACLLEKARLLVTNDSGPMHLAAIMGCPTVAIFGPTTLDLGYQPINQRVAVVQEPLACRPCGLHGHEKCPIGTHACMKNITADRVMEAIHRLLSMT